MIWLRADCILFTKLRGVSHESLAIIGGRVCCSYFEALLFVDLVMRHADFARTLIGNVSSCCLSEHDYAEVFEPTIS